jgi:cytosine deaminase
MLDRAAILAERHGLYTDSALEEAFALMTSEADKAVGGPRRELRAGAVADLVVVAAASVADAVIDRPPRSLVLRAGRIAAERGVASEALKQVVVA